MNYADNKPSIAKPVSLELDLSNKNNKNEKRYGGYIERSKSKNNHNSHHKKSKDPVRSSSKNFSGKRTPSQDKKYPQLLITSKQYDMKETHNNKVSQNGEEMSKVSRKPPLPSFKRFVSDKCTPSPSINKFIDLETPKSSSNSKGGCDSYNNQGSSNSNSKGKESSDVFDLIHHCRKVDESIGIFQSLSSCSQQSRPKKPIEPSSSKLPPTEKSKKHHGGSLHNSPNFPKQTTSKDEEENNFTEMDLVVEETEVIKNDVFFASYIGGNKKDIEVYSD